MVILQIQPNNVNYPEGLQNYILQYGILGIITVALAYIAWGQYQKLVERNNTLEEKVDKLQDMINTRLTEEKALLIKLIEDNTHALSELQKVILNFMVSKK